MRVLKLVKAACNSGRSEFARAPNYYSLTLRLMNGLAKETHVRHGYGDPPSPAFHQLEARLFSSRSEAADIISALENGYKDQTKNTSFGKNLTRFVSFFRNHYSRDFKRCLSFQELASRICEEFPLYSAKDQTSFIINLAKKFGVDSAAVKNAVKTFAQMVRL